MKEILKHLVTTTVLPEDHYLDQDPEILEIFVEELEEIFENVQPFLTQWLDHPHQDDLLVTIRRNFHTLKGSGRMVGATSSAELAWTVEDTLNRVIAKNVELSSAVQKYVISVFNLYQYKLFDDFKLPRSHHLDFRPLVLLGQQLQQNLSLEPALEELLVLSETLNHTDVITGLETDAAIDNNQVVTEDSSPTAQIEPVDTTRSTDLAEPLDFDFEVSQPTTPQSEHIEINTFKSDIVESEKQNSETTNSLDFNEFEFNQKIEPDHLLSDTLAIFVEEAEEHLATIEQFIHLDHHTPEHYNGLIRALHTLRGSSTMAKVDGLFDSSSKVEQIVKALLQEDTENSINENALLIHFAEYVRDYLHAIKTKTTDGVEFQMLQHHFDDVWAQYDFQVENLQENTNLQDVVSQILNADVGVLLDTELEFDRRARNEYPDYLQILSDQAENLIDQSNNRAAMGIHDFSKFLKSSYDALLENRNLLNTHYVFELFAKAHQQFVRLFDMLAAGQRVTLNDESKLLIEELKSYLQQDIEFLDSLTNSVPLPKTEKPVATASVEEMISSAELLPNSRSQSENKADYASISTRILQDKALIDSPQVNTEFDAEILDIFIEEADELLLAMDQDLNTWSKNLDDTHALNNLMRHLHTLKGGANMLQAEHVGLIAHELETIYELIIKGLMPVDASLLKAIRSIQDDVSDRIQTIRDDQIDYPAPNILAILHQIVDPDAASIEQQDQPSHATPQPSEQQSTSHETAATPSFDLIDEVSVESIAEESFAEEAESLISDAFVQLNQWIDQRGNRSLLLQLQRNAHSLKGGARMVGLENVARIAGELESAFEQFAVHNFNSNAYDALLEYAFNWLKTAIFDKNEQHFDALKAKLSNIQYLDVSAQLPDKLTRTEDLTEQYSAEFVQGDGTEPPSMLGEWGEDSNTEQNDEMIRISADLIEKMIDLSGENAINRSRIEMDLSQLGHTLTDMELAIQRLADQLRRMEGELESQIIAKHDDMGSRYADFDPLEMDQYSSINQLSKSLSESASDLVDFKATLAEKIKDTEGILLQQSRIQAEIQQGLMRARLVPFSRLLPRLQRLVRQVSTTLNKPTELYVNNTEGELDRTILEKLVSPLEHMLRNALDHGIESTHDRVTNNKPAMGKIELNISRQGTDILIAFTDDGKGIDANKIKSKAIEVGLIQENQQLSREQILQYIFHPGFSTADKVTQISGRGVGLDVVQSGIKSLGGEVSVTSELGQGSTFTIRVPTTVAVSDALMVKVGDQQFAVPLSQIDRIVRISPTALDEFFSSNEEFFDIDSQRYKLRYLAEFVGHQAIPKLNGIAHSLPVLLIKGAMGQTTALLVDQLIGSRSQIVMKPIGNQFSSVGAVTGATILGDGKVCLILDGQNIARQAQATLRDDVTAEQRDQQRHRDQRHLIMIVDDSVTVRKVTSRLLERHGFDVITAKDGIDAIEQLENIKPDLMLLDIEMPRMDGFEVTMHVRHHELHHDLPIVMITSRTGEKHRERAFSLGVTNYMGKPFQEGALLDSIHSALETK